MKRYRCHKTVMAAPILSVARAVRVGDEDVIQTDAGNITVPYDFFARGVPVPGDYLVRYEPDGYLSWSPKSVFEAGYSPIEEAAAGRDDGLIDHHSV